MLSTEMVEMGGQECIVEAKMSAYHDIVEWSVKVIFTC